MKFRLFALMFFAVILTITASSVFAQDTYRLGPEDIIGVNVIGHTEFSGEFYIPSDGVISFPGAGPINAIGKTIGELNTAITAKLSERLLKPEVYVSIKSGRSELIHMLGAVRNPGQLIIKPGWRLTEAVSAAGGLMPDVRATDTTVRIIRSGLVEPITVNMQMVLRGDPGANVALKPGDVITLEAMDFVPVYVMGKVRAPGLFHMRSESAGLVEALSMAGGPLDDAALAKITVTNLNGDQQTVDITKMTTEGSKIASVKLKAGDVIVVPDSFSKIVILGFVARPGIYNIKDNQVVTLTDIVGMASGFMQRAGAGSVGVIRTVDGKQQFKSYNYAKFARGGDKDGNPVLQPGDTVYVPETNSPDWNKILNSLSSGLSTAWMIDRWNQR